MELAVLFGIGAMLAWGGTDFLSAICSRKIGENLTVFWFQILGLIFLVPIYFFQKENVQAALVQIQPQDLFVFITLGLLQVLAFYFFFKGMRIGQIGIITSLASGWAVIPLFVGVFVFKEVLNLPQSIAIVVVLVGIILICGGLSSLFQRDRPRAGIREGIATLLIFGILMTVIVPYVRAWGWFAPILFLKLAALPWLLFLVRKVSWRWPTFIIFGLLLLSGFLDLSGLIFYSGGASATQHISILAPVSAAYPLVAASLAYLFLHEKLSGIRVMGAVMIIAGIVILGTQS